MNKDVCCEKCWVTGYMDSDDNVITPYKTPFCAVPICSCHSTTQKKEKSMQTTREAVRNVLRMNVNVTDAADALVLAMIDNGWTQKPPQSEGDEREVTSPIIPDTKENDGRCSQCKLEGNNGICDRKDCSGFTKENDGWEGVDDLNDIEIHRQNCTCTSSLKNVGCLRNKLEVRARLTTQIAIARADEAEKCEQHIQKAKQEEREKVIEIVRGMKKESHPYIPDEHTRIDTHNTTLEAIIEKLNKDI